ncbi:MULTISPECIES: glycerate kinase type-2 family protein [Natrialbaceae]|uniref:glycerate kinase type-2 family protein n=1 Tax=Natrialbaceae TaxID=1644061 RepID=UPI00207D71E6|nr:DUF4147 domain-containing protein [Natronococcus sp. CG52]
MSADHRRYIEDAGEKQCYLMIKNHSRLTRTQGHEVALACVKRDIKAAHPATVIETSIEVNGDQLTISPLHAATESSTHDLSAYDRIVVLGGGNAAGRLAKALEAEFGEHLTEGIVATDVVAATNQIEVLKSDHPVPSERGVAAAERVLEAAKRAGPNDLVIGCISGGGSALLPAPVNGVSLRDLQETTEALLESGATIEEINAVRKHISRIKGGRLAQAAAPALVIGILLSDVVGDDPGVIASGPFTPDPTSFNDALDVLERYSIDPPAAVVNHLRDGQRGQQLETPTATEVTHTSTYVLASNRTALEAARTEARERGYESVVLSANVRGEARKAAKTHVAIAEESRATGDPVSPPVVFLSGGETTVTLVDDSGDGGPNQEFALSAALELDDDNVIVASVDTDGIDGATNVAGAIVESSTVDDLADRMALARNDARIALKEAGALIHTGPTGTNVNDLRVLVVEEG